MKKEKEVSENGNKVLLKGPKLGVAIVVGVILVILLGMQIYASTNGYGNVFFMLKTLVTGEAHGEGEIFYDKEITLSNKSFEVADGVKMQINKLQIKENESTLCLTVKATKDTILPLKYSIEAEGLSKTDVKSSNAKNTGEFTEELTVSHKFADNEKMNLYISDKDGKLLKEVEINLSSREIIVKGESEVGKISQIELKKYLNVFSELNNGIDKEDSILEMANEIWINVLEQKEVETREIDNEIIKEFYGDKAEFKNAKDENGKEVEVFKYGSAWTYGPHDSGSDYIYMTTVDFSEYKHGICLKIEDVDYKDGIYTVKYIYTLATGYDIDDEKLEELPQYEATIKLKRNEEAKYSKYQIVELSKGTEVEEKVSTKVDEEIYGSDEKLIANYMTGDPEQLKTEQHNGYYTYKDMFNNEYNIKNIEEVNIEFCDYSNDGWYKLYKVTLTYKDNKDKKANLELAVIVDDHNSDLSVWGTFDNYTGTTRFVRTFTDLYDDGSETEDTNSNTEKNVVSEGNAPQLNKTLSNIKEKAIKTFDMTNTTTIKYEYDFNNDGVNETLNFSKNEREELEILYNNKEFLSENTMHKYITKGYLVDLDKNDGKLDLVLCVDFASDDWTFEIYTFNGNTFEQLTDTVLWGTEMFIDEQGTVLTQSGAYVGTNPIISNSYFDYKGNRTKELNADSLKGLVVTFNDVFFTKDVNNINKYHEYVGDLGFDKAIEKANIKKYDSVKCYVRNVSTHTDKIEVELEDGTKGYLFVANGNFAG